MTDTDKTADLPGELKDKLASLDSSLTTLEANLQPLLKTSLSEMNSKLVALDKAKMDLVAVYTINSLFWVYLNANGINPKEHPIKQELDRIKGYMARVKEIQDKVKAPKLDKAAANRFVKSALWQAALKQTYPEQNTDKNLPKSSQTINASSRTESQLTKDNQSNQSKSDLWKTAQQKGSSQAKTDSQEQSKSALWKAAHQKTSTHKRFSDSEPDSTPTPKKKKKGKKNK